MKENPLEMIAVRVSYRPTILPFVAFSDTIIPKETERIELEVSSGKIKKKKKRKR